jgi:Transglutaminase elicitor
MADVGSQGAANWTPWSGHWWPTYSGNNPNMFDAGGPMAKYDQYVQNTRGQASGAQAWENQNHRTDDPELDWAGHCHAVAAASILTPVAPAGGVSRGGVEFSQDDLEGLVAALYYNPTYEMLPGGVRSNTDDVTAPEFQDMNPAWMNYLLDYYLTQNNYPFIMDTAAGAQVWNFPVFAHQSQQTSNADGTVDTTHRLWFSDAAAGEANTRYFYKDYTYKLWDAGGGRMDGQWTGASVNDHPDFAWVPTGKAEGGGKNPHIDESVVEEILGYGV